MNRKAISVSIICMMLTASFVMVSLTAGKSNPKDINPKNIVAPAKPMIAPPGVPAVLGPQKPDLPGTINGATNPELISDHAAWSAMFALIANHKTPEERRRVRGYAKLLGLGCASCNGIKGSAVSLDDQAAAEADIDNLIRVAHEYALESKTLDSLAGFPLPAPASLSEQVLMAKVTALKQQKEHLVSTKVTHLSQNLTPKGYEALRGSLDKVKRNIKIVPYPPMPPGK